MIKIVTIVGARPQIIKAAALSRAIRNHFSANIIEIIVHTGQHYDENMSQVFFDELEIPHPDYNLNVGSKSHAKQTAQMIDGIESILLETSPDYLVVYGDTNSTLAGAIAASKLNVPIVHIEAGLRSYNKTMPEEINRILCDHTSTLLFTPTLSGINNLVKEGFIMHNKPPFSSDNPGVFHCGDIMYDNSLYFKSISDKTSTIIKDNDLGEEEFILCTIHRDNNTDDITRLNELFNSINEIAEDYNISVVIPMHPRTKNAVETNLDTELLNKLNSNTNIKLLQPVSYLDMIALESNCKIVMTDSGGVQKESYFYEKPCLILRSETEWVEIVKAGAGIITDANKENIIGAFDRLNQNPPTTFPKIFGDGHTAEFICSTILNSGQ